MIFVFPLETKICKFQININSNCGHWTPCLFPISMINDWMLFNGSIFIIFVTNGATFYNQPNAQNTVFEIKETLKTTL